MRQAMFAFGFALLDGEIADLGGLLECRFLNLGKPGRRPKVQRVSNHGESVGDVVAVVIVSIVLLRVPEEIDEGAQIDLAEDRE